jgi:DNA-binding transcriptional LysR family regulator
MELRQLHYFLTVAEELHFGRAAERLHIVQSAVSQQIRRLERDLGTDLFDRTTRTVRLTEAGKLLLPHARQMLATAAKARTAIDELRAEHATTVRLGTSVGLGARLEIILAEFARLSGNSTLELVTAETDERLRRVRSGELDATLLRGERPAPGLELLPLWEDPLMVALPARHDLAVRGVIDMADLAGLPFEPEFGPEFTTDQDTLAAIGFGKPSWTVFYAPQAEQLPVPGVVFRPLRDPAPVMRAFLAVRPDPPGAGLRALIEACNAP